MQNRGKEIGFIMVTTILLMFFVTYNYYQQVYLAGPDGQLYLSIADNFLANGHFTQTTRPYMNGHVATPGLPIILTILKLIVNSSLFVAFVQYILFGLSNVFLYLTCINIFQKRLVGVSAVVIYLVTMMDSQGIYISPSCIQTEHWALFVLMACMYIVSKLYNEGVLCTNCIRYFKYIYLLIFVGFLIRPIIFMCYAPLFLYFIYLAVHKKIKRKDLLFFLAIPILFFSINVAVNYRETGEFVLLENYSAIPLYQANNPNTKTSGYASDLTYEFVEEGDIFYEIYNNPNLNCTQQNKMLRDLTNEYIRSNLMQVIKTSLQRFRVMFLEAWGRSFEVMIAAMIILSLRYRKKWIFYVGGVGTMLFLALPTSCGLNIWRYSIVAIPFYTFYKAALIGEIYNLTVWISKKL